MFKALKWEDWLGLSLGLWLLLSPWILGYAESSAAATMNALFLGTALICLELLNLDAHEDLEEWFDIVAGAWLVVSPALLGFIAVTAAAINAVGVGLLTIAFAAWALSPFDQRLTEWRQHMVHH